jgi:hypothetical protein
MKWKNSQKLLKQTQEETENMNRSIVSKEIGSVIKKKYPTKKSPEPNDFVKHFQMFK